MPKYVLILTQEISNLSVKILAHAIAQKFNLNFDQNYRVLICNVDDIKITNKFISFDRALNTLPVCVRATIAISDIALAIKRTWGPIREKALSLCQQLEKEGVIILNGCEFISWSHAKIKQYDSLKTHRIFPNTVCFTEDFVSLKTPDEGIEEVLENIYANNLEFPLVFKTNKGCLGDGVYLTEDANALKKLLIELFRNNSAAFKSGFLLQTFIPTHHDKYISNYYRINLVNGCAQSAVQFQLKWTPVNGSSYKKLSDFAMAEDKPISLCFFNEEQLEKIVAACPCKKGVVGVDVVQDSISNNLFLLEYNDGPAISHIVALAEKYKNDLGYAQAVKECGDFGNEIAALCCGLVEQPAFEFKAKL